MPRPEDASRRNIDAALVAARRMSNKVLRHGFYGLFLGILESLAACSPAAAPTSAPTTVSVNIPRVSASASDPEPPQGPPNMVYLRGGRFKMAWTKEYPSEEFVTVASFWLDKTEVTTRDFRSHVRAGKDLVCDEYATWGTREKEDHPMNCVNHFQAAAYCAFVDKRLPTLAEWEWAARGGRRGSKYPWGDAEPSDQLCWKRGFFATTGEGEGTCPVGSFPAGNTPEGIADLMGNVTEWTSTPNPNADTYMFVRGHNWSDFDPENMWIEPYSGSISSDDHSPYIGFRCALSVNSTNAP